MKGKNIIQVKRQKNLNNNHPQIVTSELELPLILREIPKTTRNDKMVFRRNYDSIELLLKIKKNSNLLSRKDNTIFDKYLENLGPQIIYSDNSLQKDHTLNSMLFKSDLSKVVSPKLTNSKFTVRKSKIDNDLVTPLKFIIKPMKIYNPTNLISEDRLALEENISPIKKKNVTTKIKSIIPQNVKIKNFKPNVAKKFLVMTHEKFL